MGKQRTLRIRNRTSTGMRFEVPSVGLEVPVAAGETANLLLPGDGRVEYVCRSDEGSSKGELVRAPSGSEWRSMPPFACGGRHRHRGAMKPLLAVR